MKSGLQKITHAAAVVFGLLLTLAWLYRQQAVSAPSHASDKAEAERNSRQSADGGGNTDGKPGPRGQRAIPKFRASEYKRAWDAIADQSLPSQQRYFLQVEILRQWAEVDLEGALAAAFDTSWDGNNGMGLRGLLQAFDQVFAKRPTESWDLITSGRFGLGASIAKGRWAEAVVKENPLLVANSLRQIPYNTRRSIFPQVLAVIKEDPSKIGAFYDKLTELPQDNLYRDMVLQSVSELGPRSSLEDVRSKFLGSTSEAERTILIHEFGKSLAGMDAAAVKGQLSLIPEEDRARMLRSAAIHMNPGERPSGMLEMLLQAGEYNQVARQMDEKIRTYASTPEKQASLAAWTVTLQNGPDAAGIIHRSVSGYITSDPQGARSWLESVPASNWGRNTALAEYSQQMLNKHNNPEESAWALAQINDPKIKENATRWRGAWEKRQR